MQVNSRWPTPCTQWDVRATLDHLIGATWMFALVNEGRAVGEDAGGVGGDDPGVAFATRRGQPRIVAGPGAIDGDRTFPFGTFPAVAARDDESVRGRRAHVGLATALGADPTIDPNIAGMVDEFYRRSRSSRTVPTAHSGQRSSSTGRPARRSPARCSAADPCDR